VASGRTLYDVLGVRPDASADELRRSYLQRARLLHPDRHVDAGSARRAEVERQMQDLTAAWQVLGDARRRRRYDEQEGIGVREPAPDTSEQPRFVTRLDGTTEADVGPVEVDGLARLARGIPWIALIAVLVIIFIFSAYALTGKPGAGDIGNGTKTGTCVLITGGSPSPAPCDTKGARVVITLVGASSPCPQGTERFQPTSGNAAYCLEG
jgi:hypothetical protein